MKTEAQIGRDKGIAQAVNHAVSKCPEWSLKAKTFLGDYMKTHKEFMAEDVILASTGVVPAPPDPRAWGGAFASAARSGILERIGYAPIKNPKAHCRPAPVWRVK